MLRWIKYIVPPANWTTPVIIVVGIFTGLFVYTFKISNAISYASDKPETCINCHIMVPQYATWSHSSHRENATCNDCHVPQDNIFNSYYFKAKDGLRHATIFTLRKEPQVIFIKEEGAAVVQQNCIRCHENLLQGHHPNVKSNEFYSFKEERKCLECHKEVPHGRVNSLSSVPHARVPQKINNISNWILKSLQ